MTTHNDDTDPDGKYVLGTNGIEFQRLPMKKALTITKFVIRVSKNDLIESGYFIEVRARGILPGCRKDKTLFFTPMAGYIWTKPLYDHNGEARISPDQWRELVKTAPVVESSLEYDRCPITPEIESMARQQESRLADSAEGQLNNDEFISQRHLDNCASGEIYTKVIRK
jgi:hypothetical protein